MKTPVSIKQADNFKVAFIFCDPMDINIAHLIGKCNGNPVSE
jgi:hypothetical protein